jgi:hypothetical protein
MNKIYLFAMMAVMIFAGSLIVSSLISLAWMAVTFSPCPDLIRWAVGILFAIIVTYKIVTAPPTEKH